MMFSSVLKQYKCKFKDQLAKAQSEKSTAFAVHSATALIFASIDAIESVSKASEKKRKKWNKEALSDTNPIQIDRNRNGTSSFALHTISVYNGECNRSSVYSAEEHVGNTETSRSDLPMGSRFSSDANHDSATKVKRNTNRANVQGPGNHGAFDNEGSVRSHRKPCSATTSDSQKGDSPLQSSLSPNGLQSDSYSFDPCALLDAEEEGQDACLYLTGLAHGVSKTDSCLQGDDYSDPVRFRSLESSCRELRDFECSLASSSLPFKECLESKDGQHVEEKSAQESCSILDNYEQSQDIEYEKGSREDKTGFYVHPNDCMGGKAKGSLDSFPCRKPQNEIEERDDCIRNSKEVLLRDYNENYLNGFKSRSFSVPILECLDPCFDQAHLKDGEFTTRWETYVTEEIEMTGSSSDSPSPIGKEKCDQAAMSQADTISAREILLYETSKFPQRTECSMDAFAANICEDTSIFPEKDNAEEDKKNKVERENSLDVDTKQGSHEPVSQTLEFARDVDVSCNVMFHSRGNGIVPRSMIAGKSDFFHYQTNAINRKDLPWECIKENLADSTEEHFTWGDRSLYQPRYGANAKDEETKCTGVTDHGAGFVDQPETISKNKHHVESAACADQVINAVEYKENAPLARIVETDACEGILNCTAFLNEEVKDDFLDLSGGMISVYTPDTFTQQRSERRKSNQGSFNDETYLHDDQQAASTTYDYLKLKASHDTLVHATIPSSQCYEATHTRGARQGVKDEFGGREKLMPNSYSNPTLQSPEINVLGLEKELKQDQSLKEDDYSDEKEHTLHTSDEHSTTSQYEEQDEIKNFDLRGLAPHSCVTSDDVIEIDEIDPSKKRYADCDLMESAITSYGKHFCDPLNTFKSEERRISHQQLSPVNNEIMSTEPKKPCEDQRDEAQDTKGYSNPVSITEEKKMKEDQNRYSLEESPINYGKESSNCKTSLPLLQEQQMTNREMSKKRPTRTRPGLPKYCEQDLGIDRNNFESTGNKPELDPNFYTINSSNNVDNTALAQSRFQKGRHIVEKIGEKENSHFEDLLLPCTDDNLLPNDDVHGDDKDFNTNSVRSYGKYVAETDALCKIGMEDDCSINQESVHVPRIIPENDSVNEGLEISGLTTEESWQSLCMSNKVPFSTFCDDTLQHRETDVSNKDRNSLTERRDRIKAEDHDFDKNDIFVCKQYSVISSQNFLAFSDPADNNDATQLLHIEPLNESAGILVQGNFEGESPKFDYFQGKEGFSVANYQERQNISFQNHSRLPPSDSCNANTLDPSVKDLLYYEDISSHDHNLKLEQQSNDTCAPLSPFKLLATVVYDEEVTKEKKVEFEHPNKKSSICITRYTLKHEENNYNEHFSQKYDKAVTYETDIRISNTLSDKDGQSFDTIMTKADYHASKDPDQDPGDTVQLLGRHKSISDSSTDMENKDYIQQFDHPCNEDKKNSEEEMPETRDGRRNAQKQVFDNFYNLLNSHALSGNHTTNMDNTVDTHNADAVGSDDDINKDNPNTEDMIITSRDLQCETEDQDAVDSLYWDNSHPLSGNHTTNMDNTVDTHNADAVGSDDDINKDKPNTEDMIITSRDPQCETEDQDAVDSLYLDNSHPLSGNHTTNMDNTVDTHNADAVGSDDDINKDNPNTEDMIITSRDPQCETEDRDAVDSLYWDNSHPLSGNHTTNMDNTVDTHNADAVGSDDDINKDNPNTEDMIITSRDPQCETEDQDAVDSFYLENSHALSGNHTTNMDNTVDTHNADAVGSDDDINKYNLNTEDIIITSREPQCETEDQDAVDSFYVENSHALSGNHTTNMDNTVDTHNADAVGSDDDINKDNPNTEDMIITSGDPQCETEDQDAVDSLYWDNSHALSGNHTTNMDNTVDTHNADAVGSDDDINKDNPNTEDMIITSRDPQCETEDQDAVDSLYWDNSHPLSGNHTTNMDNTVDTHNADAVGSEDDINKDKPNTEDMIITSRDLQCETEDQDAVDSFYLENSHALSGNHTTNMDNTAATHDADVVAGDDDINKDNPNTEDIIITSRDPQCETEDQDAVDSFYLENSHALSGNHTTNMDNTAATHDADVVAGDDDINKDRPNTEDMIITSRDPQCETDEQDAVDSLYFENSQALSNNHTSKMDDTTFVHQVDVVLHDDDCTKGRPNAQDMVINTENQDLASMDDHTVSCKSDVVAASNRFSNYGHNVKKIFSIKKNQVCRAADSDTKGSLPWHDRDAVFRHHSTVINYETVTFKPDFMVDNDFWKEDREDFENLTMNTQNQLWEDAEQDVEDSLYWKNSHACSSQDIQRAGNQTGTFKANIIFGEDLHKNSRQISDETRTDIDDKLWKDGENGAEESLRWQKGDPCSSDHLLSMVEQILTRKDKVTEDSDFYIEDKQYFGEIMMKTENRPWEDGEQDAESSSLWQDKDQCFSDRSTSMVNQIVTCNDNTNIFDHFFSKNSRNIENIMTSNEDQAAGVDAEESLQGQNRHSCLGDHLPSMDEQADITVTYHLSSKNRQSIEEKQTSTKYLLWEAKDIGAEDPLDSQDRQGCSSDQSTSTCDHTVIRKTDVNDTDDLYNKGRQNIGVIGTDTEDQLCEVAGKNAEEFLQWRERHELLSNNVVDLDYQTVICEAYTDSLDLKDVNFSPVPDVALFEDQAHICETIECLIPSCNEDDYHTQSVLVISQCQKTEAVIVHHPDTPGSKHIEDIFYSTELFLEDKSIATHSNLNSFVTFTKENKHISGDSEDASNSHIKDAAIPDQERTFGRKEEGAYSCKAFSLLKNPETIPENELRSDTHSFYEGMGIEGSPESAECSEIQPSNKQGEDTFELHDRDDDFCHHVPIIVNKAMSEPQLNFAASDNQKHNCGIQEEVHAAGSEPSKAVASNSLYIKLCSKENQMLDGEEYSEAALQEENHARILKLEEDSRLTDSGNTLASNRRAFAASEMELKENEKRERICTDHGFLAKHVVSTITKKAYYRHEVEDFKSIYPQANLSNGEGMKISDPCTLPSFDDTCTHENEAQEMTDQDHTNERKTSRILSDHEDCDVVLPERKGLLDHCETKPCAGVNSELAFDQMIEIRKEPVKASLTTGGGDVAMQDNSQKLAGRSRSFQKENEVCESANFLHIEEFQNHAKKDESGIESHLTGIVEERAHCVDYKEETKQNSKIFLGQKSSENHQGNFELKHGEEEWHPCSSEFHREFRATEQEWLNKNFTGQQSSGKIKNARNGDGVTNDDYGLFLTMSRETVLKSQSSMGEGEDKLINHEAVVFLDTGSDCSIAKCENVNDTLGNCAPLTNAEKLRVTKSVEQKDFDDDVFFHDTEMLETIGKERSMSLKDIYQGTDLNDEHLGEKICDVAKVSEPSKGQSDTKRSVLNIILRKSLSNSLSEDITVSEDMEKKEFMEATLSLKDRADSSVDKEKYSFHMYNEEAKENFCDSKDPINHIDNEYTQMDSGVSDLTVWNVSKNNFKICSEGSLLIDEGPTENSHGANTTILDDFITKKTVPNSAGKQVTHFNTKDVGVNEMFTKGSDSFQEVTSETKRKVSNLHRSLANADQLQASLMNNSTNADSDEKDNNTSIPNTKNADNLNVIQTLPTLEIDMDQSVLNQNSNCIAPPPPCEKLDIAESQDVTFFLHLLDHCCPEQSNVDFEKPKDSLHGRKRVRGKLERQRSWEGSLHRRINSLNSVSEDNALEIENVYDSFSLQSLQDIGNPKGVNYSEQNKDGTNENKVLESLVVLETISTVHALPYGKDDSDVPWTAESGDLPNEWGQENQIVANEERSSDTTNKAYAAGEMAPKESENTSRSKASAGSLDMIVDKKEEDFFAQKEERRRRLRGLGRDSESSQGGTTAVLPSGLNVQDLNTSEGQAKSGLTQQLVIPEGINLQLSSKSSDMNDSNVLRSQSAGLVQSSAGRRRRRRRRKDPDSEEDYNASGEEKKATSKPPENGSSILKTEQSILLRESENNASEIQLDPHQAENVVKAETEENKSEKSLSLNSKDTVKKGEESKSAALKNDSEADDILAVRKRLRSRLNRLAYTYDKQDDIASLLDSFKSSATVLEHENLFPDEKKAPDDINNQPSLTNKSFETAAKTTAQAESLITSGPWEDVAAASKVKRTKENRVSQSHLRTSCDIGGNNEVQNTNSREKTDTDDVQSFQSAELTSPTNNQEMSGSEGKTTGYASPMLLADEYEDPLEKRARLRRRLRGSSQGESSASACIVPEGKVSFSRCGGIVVNELYNHHQVSEVKPEDEGKSRLQEEMNTENADSDETCADSKVSRVNEETASVASTCSTPLSFYSDNFSCGLEGCQLCGIKNMRHLMELLHASRSSLENLGERDVARERRLSSSVLDFWNIYSSNCSLDSSGSTLTYSESGRSTPCMEKFQEILNRHGITNDRDMDDEVNCRSLNDRFENCDKITSNVKRHKRSMPALEGYKLGMSPLVHDVKLPVQKQDTVDMSGNEEDSDEDTPVVVEKFEMDNLTDQESLEYDKAREKKNIFNFEIENFSDTKELSTMGGEVDERTKSKSQVKQKKLRKTAERRKNILELKGDSSSDDHFDAPVSAFRKTNSAFTPVRGKKPPAISNRSTKNEYSGGVLQDVTGAVGDDNLIRPDSGIVLEERNSPMKMRTFSDVTGLCLSRRTADKFNRTGHHRCYVLLVPYDQIEDVALQLSHNGTYLDMESTLEEQADELEGFKDSRKNTIILRTQLSVRVHNIIAKLLSATGRDLRRALFSLKQIFQDDKDLVHEFVTADGLSCLITVGTDADQNYQNYILRAIGQIMLYVDGMNGVIQHNETIQWLYSLLSSKYRLVQKTSLKLLLVFVEYTENNSRLLWQAIQAVDTNRAAAPTRGLIDILSESDSGTDDELLVYALTLVNKVLYATPDQDTFYDVTDALEEQGMEGVMKKLLNRTPPNKDLTEQCNIYEASLKAEDGDENQGLYMAATGVRQRRSKGGKLDIDDGNRRRSRRHSAAKRMSDPSSAPDLRLLANGPHSLSDRVGGEDLSLNKQMSNSSPELDAKARRRQLRKERRMNRMSPLTNDSTEDSPKPEEESHHNLSRKTSLSRRERRERRQSKDSTEEKGPIKIYENGYPTSPAERKEFSPPVSPHSVDQRSPKISMRQRFDVDDTQPERKSLRDRMASSSSSNDAKTDAESTAMDRERNKKNAAEEQVSTQRKTSLDSSDSKRMMLRMFYGQSIDKGDSDTGGEGSSSSSGTVSSNHVSSNKIETGETINDRKTNLAKNAVKPEEEDKKQLETINEMKGIVGAKQNVLASKPQQEVAHSEPTKPSGDKSGLLSRMKNALTKQPDAHAESAQQAKAQEAARSTEDIELENRVLRSRPLKINEFDFTDLKEDDDDDVMSVRGNLATGPPPPPPGFGVPPPPGGAPPPPPGMPPQPPPPPGAPPPPPGHSGSKKDKDRKFVRLFWQEVRNLPASGLSKTIWCNLEPVDVDTRKLEHLFENRVKSGTLRRADSEEKMAKKEIVVLELKRAQAINIVLTKLPPIRAIKQAILDMDSAVIDREGIEKIMAMMPTEDEKTKIQEAQLQFPETPLAHAEHFLLTLASINELHARLNLWAFKLDYDNTEREIAEGLSDLKYTAEQLRKSATFKRILGTLLAIGCFLNGVKIKGFNLDYLAKVPEVRDTVHKQSLLYHLCCMVMEKFPESSDLYSELGSVHRASRCDFDNIVHLLKRLDDSCRRSWEYLRLIAKHDSSSPLKTKLTEFLADAGERIAILKVVHRRVHNRFRKLLVYLGVNARNAKETKPHEFCKVISEFSLEYRTVRQKVIEQKKKKENKRTRTKTRGKMITESENFTNATTAVPVNNKPETDVNMQAFHDALIGDGGRDSLKSASKSRLRAASTKAQQPASPVLSGSNAGGNYDTDDQTDQMMDMLVKSATSADKRTRIRKNRAKDSKSVRKSVRRTRTLKTGLTPEEVEVLQLNATG